MIDLPLILILTVIYADFLPLEFGKIQIFFLKIWQNRDFFSGMPKDFLYIFFFLMMMGIFLRITALLPLTCINLLEQAFFFLTHSQCHYYHGPI